MGGTGGSRALPRRGHPEEGPPPMAALGPQGAAAGRGHVGTGHGWGQPWLTWEFGAAAASSASDLGHGRSPPHARGVTTWRCDVTSPVDRRWPKLRFTPAVPTVPKHCSRQPQGCPHSAPPVPSVPTPRFGLVRQRCGLDTGPRPARNLPLSPARVAPRGAGQPPPLRGDTTRLTPG